MTDETCQQRNMRMGWGCKCHGETFCPDEICVDMVDDVPVFANRHSAEGRAAVANQTAQADRRERAECERLRRKLG